MRSLIVAIGIGLSVSLVLGADPDCAGVERWPAGIITNDKVDWAKTKTVRLASERVGKDLYRQVHRVTFTEGSGNTIEVITVSDA